MLCRYLAADKLLTHLSGCQCLESNHPTLLTEGALKHLSPRGGHIEGVLLLTTPSWTHNYTCAYTLSWTLTAAHARTQTRGPCAHRWSNHRHFNHWTLLLWGTADIAGSGQKKRPLTDFNLDLMTVVWAWMLCCSYFGRCHFFSGICWRYSDGFKSIECSTILFRTINKDIPGSNIGYRTWEGIWWV